MEGQSPRFDLIPRVRFTPRIRGKGTKSTVIMFESRSPDISRQLIDTGMEIQDVKVIGETVFVVTIGETMVFDADAGDVHHLALSKDCL